MQWLIGRDYRLDRRLSLTDSLYLIFIVSSFFNFYMLVLMCVALRCTTTLQSYHLTYRHQRRGLEARPRHLWRVARAVQRPHGGRLIANAVKTLHQFRPAWCNTLDRLLRGTLTHTDSCVCGGGGGGGGGGVGGTLVAAVDVYFESNNLISRTWRIDDVCVRFLIYLIPDSDDA